MTLAIVPSANRPPAANVKTPETQALLTRLAPDNGFCRVASTKGKGHPWLQHNLPVTSLESWSMVRGIRHHNQYVGVPVNDYDGSVLETHALHLDLDFCLVGEDAKQAEEQVRTAIARFPLPPSALVNSGGGVQLYLFLQEPASLRTEDERAHIRSLLRRLTVLLPGADILCAFPECVLRLPDSNNVKYTPPKPVTTEYVHVDRAYTLAQFETLLADVQEPRESPEGKRLFESLNTQDTIPEGQRDHTLFRIGCSLRAKGCEEPDIFKHLTRENTQRCSPPLSQAEVEKCSRSAAKYEKGAKKTFPNTEAGDAEFFAARHKDDVRWDHSREHWLIYDGNRWKPDAEGLVVELAVLAMRERQGIAVAMPAGDEHQTAHRKACINWAVRGESRNRIMSMLFFVKGLEPIRDDGKNWNTNPDLLGVDGGVVSMKTGELRKGTPEDRITNCTRVKYRPDAVSELWNSTLEAIFEGSKELIAYWHRLVGYSASGTSQEEMFAMLWGGGRNGKGTLVEAIRRALGDYADDLPFASLEKNARSAIANDMAKLPGKRFVTASETEGSVRLNEPRLKQLSGRDPQTCRFLHQEFFSYDPMFVLFLATNEKPEIRDYTDGFWERVQLVPFTRQFLTDRDPTIKTRLKEESEHQEAILAWIVSGCLLWQKHGLCPPAEVVEATKEYRIDSEPLTAFLEECCTVDDDASTAFKPVWTRYQQWEGKGKDALNRQGFINALGKKFKKHSTGRKVMYEGLSVGVEDSTETDRRINDWTSGDVPPPETEEKYEM